MANAAFGIEHPLVTVRDIAAVAARYEALGFAPRPLGRHPWGTVNRLVMFADNFIELIAVEDEAAIEADPVGGHIFGRRVRDSLKLGEGISLLALHSKDVAADEAAAMARGAWSAGRVEFRRAVRLPDGSEDEAVVSLAVLPDDAHPRLGVFLCQQHKPHLVWNPDWLAHPNGADAISAVTVLAPEPAAVAGRLRQVWGAAAVAEQPGGWRVETAGGLLHVLDEEAVLARFPGMRLPVGAGRRAPCGVAISVHTARFHAAVVPAMRIAGVRVEEGAARRILVPAAYAGGVILEIHG
ncbi:MAG: VOC family protein [Rhodospirillales bacterium]|nr:VOC family protein [Rhodospirillales bacterium]